MPYSKDCLEVIFSSDDNYARHMGTAAYSLLIHNRNFAHVNIYMIDNGISPENIQRLRDTVAVFPNADLIFIDFSSWKNKLKLNLSWPISLSSYARLFVDSMLPASVGRILYLDCDMIICSSLYTLWNSDLGGSVIGAVQDFVCDGTKQAVGMNGAERYFNAGMLLIDMDEWRSRRIEDACLAFLDEHKGNVTHHDQGVLNGVLCRMCCILPIEYNLMTIHFIFNRRKLNRYFKDHATFYSPAEVENAKKSPVILHFTPSFTSRPWVRSCRHPLRSLYKTNLDGTPWKDTAPIRDNTKWYVRLINWRYRCLPY